MIFARSGNINLPCFEEFSVCRFLFSILIVMIHGANSKEMIGPVTPGGKSAGVSGWRWRDGSGRNRLPEALTIILRAPLHPGPESLSLSMKNWITAQRYEED
jgi:hypothetical protein